MKITKSKQDKPLYDGHARITQHETGVLISENRSTGGDKRISATSVLLTHDELVRACSVAGIEIHQKGGLTIEATNQLPPIDNSFYGKLRMIFGA